MTKQQFLTNQALAQRKRESQSGKRLGWFFAMVYFSTFMGGSYLIGMLVYALAKGATLRSCGTVLIEITMCLAVAFVFPVYRRQRIEKLRRMYTALSLQCPVCGKYAARKADVDAGTGLCWNCGTQLFDSEAKNGQVMAQKSP